ncbi:sulfatase-like hydrolase/transferase [bacterium]|nr:sulfatase-like hydrolase/transferase [candidate division CSSED10-310 bacterium]
MFGRRSRKKRHPLWYLIWGGFNAGAVLGLLDALLVMVFGLGTFIRPGSIFGLIFFDALIMGIWGIASVVFGYALTLPLRSRFRRLPAALSGVILLALFLSFTAGNMAWSVRPVRGLPPENARNLLMFTLDTLRADAVGFGGNAIVRTPVMDRLARKGWQFCNAVCPVPMTTPSHASLLTSTIPAVHGALENRYRLGPDNETATEIFRVNGYRTAAFVSCFPLDRKFGLDQGFMIYNDELGIPGDLRQASPLKFGLKYTTRDLRERPARWTNSLVRPWLSRYASDNPFFLWIHYFDPHAPYQPPDPEIRYYRDSVDNHRTYTDEQDWAKARAAVGTHPDRVRPGIPECLYLGEVSTVDKAVEQILFDTLRLRIDRLTDIVLVADHGESFGEHGRFYTHGEDIYEPALSIPMIICGDAFEKYTLTDKLVSITDLMPTVLSGYGLPTGKSMNGFDLRRTDRERTHELVENYGIILAEDADKQRGIRTRHWKCILSGDNRSRRLFNLNIDPMEKQDMQEQYNDIAVRLDELIVHGFEMADVSRKPVDPDMSKETLEKMKSLGYVF